MGAQTLEFTINPASALKALSQINSGLQDSEGKFTKAGSSLQGAFEKVTDTLIKLTDRQYAANERLVKSYEAQAAAINKTGTDKLIAQRDLIIKRLGDEEGQVNRVRAAYDKLIQAQEGGSGGKFKEFGDGIKNFIEQPMQGAGTAVSGFLEKLGPMGVGITATVGVMTAFGIAAYEAAKSLGYWGVQMNDLQLRTGFTAKQLGEFDFAAKAAGADAGVFERAMRGLTVAIEDQGAKGEKARAWLHQWGVSLSDVKNGTADTADTLKKIGAGLDALPSGIQRNTAAIDVFKRAGIELIPTLVELNENLAYADKKGFGFDPKSVDSAKQVNKELAEFDHLYDAIKRKAENAIVITVKYVTGWGSPSSGGIPAGTQTDIIDQEFQAALNKSGIQNRVNQAPGQDVVSQVIAQGIAGHNKGVATYNSDMTKYGQSEEGLKGLLSKAEETAKTSREAYDEVGKSTSSTIGQINQAREAWLKAEEAVTKYRNSIQSIADAKEATKRFPGLIAGLQKEITESDQRTADLFAKAGIRQQISQENETPDVKEFEKRQKGVAETFINEQKANAASLLKYQEEMIKLQSGPGGELETAQKMYELKSKTATSQVEQIILYRDYLTQAAAIQLEADKKHQEQLEQQAKKQQEMIERIQEQQHEEVSKDASGLFKSLFQKNPGASFSKELRTLTIDKATKTFGESVADVLVPGGNKQHNEMQKAGLDTNTQATQMNTAATYTLAQTIAAGMGISLAVPPSVSVGGGGSPSVSVSAVSVPSASRGIPGGFGGFAASPGFAVPVGTGSGGYSLSFPFSGGDSSGSFSGGGFTPSYGAGYDGFSVPSRSGGGSGGGFSFPNLGGLFRGGGFGSAGSPGGTSGFAGPVNLGGRPGGGFNLGAFKNIGGLWTPPTGTGNPGTMTTSIDEYGNTVQTPGTAGSFNAQGAESMGAGFATSFGTSLAAKGLGGKDRGTGTGVAESTGGGALTGAGIGFQVGGPLGAGFGAIIGAAAGAIAGSIEMMAGDISPMTKAKRDVKARYGLTIPNQEANKIVAIAQSKYGGNVSLAVASPEVRQMLGIYAAGTGQAGNGALLATTPHAAGLTEQGGSLYQTQESIYGQSYSFRSGIPVMGGATGTPYAAPGGYAGSSPVNLSLNVSGNSTADFLNGQIVTADNITNAYMQNRVSNSALMNQPGLIA